MSTPGSMQMLSERIDSGIEPSSPLDSSLPSATLSSGPIGEPEFSPEGQDNGWTTPRNYVDLDLPDGLTDSWVSSDLEHAYRSWERASTSTAGSTCVGSDSESDEASLTSSV